MNIFMQPKITQKHSKLCVFSLETSENTIFTLIAAQRELHLSKKGQRKNLAQAIYYKDTPKGTLQNVSSGYAGRTNAQCQTRYLSHADYIYS